MTRWRLGALAAAAALGGSLSAHLAGASASLDPGEAGETIRRSVGALPTILAIASAVALALLSASRGSVRIRALALATSPLLAFLLQERLERWLSAESSPFGGPEPTLLATAIALLPWMLGAYLLVRALAVVARAAAAGSAPALAIVPPSTILGLAPVKAARWAPSFDPILDRPPRAPPRL